MTHNNDQTKEKKEVISRSLKENNKTMGCKNTFFLVLVVTLITKEALAAKHLVGGSQGWDPSTDFNSWVSGQTFKVGDQLGMLLIYKYLNLSFIMF